MVIYNFLFGGLAMSEINLGLVLSFIRPSLIAQRINYYRVVEERL
jgi:hypothetical protein